MFEVTSEASAGMVGSIEARIRALRSLDADLAFQLTMLSLICTAFRRELDGVPFVWPARSDRWHYLSDGAEVWSVFASLSSERRRVSDDLGEAVDAWKRFQK